MLSNCTLHSQPQIVYILTHKKALCLKRILGLKPTSDLKWYTYTCMNPKKGSLPQTPENHPENTLLHLSCYIFVTVRSDQGWSIAVVSGLVLLNPHCLISTVFKRDYIALWMTNYSPPSKRYPTDNILPATHYYITITIENVQMI